LLLSPQLLGRCKAWLDWLLLFFLLLLCVPLCCGPHGAGDVRMCPRWDLLLEGYSSSSVYGFINHILYTVNGV